MLEVDRHALAVDKVDKIGLVGLISGHRCAQCAQRLGTQRIAVELNDLFCGFKPDESLANLARNGGGLFSILASQPARPRPQPLESLHRGCRGLTRAGKRRSSAIQAFRCGSTATRHQHVSRGDGVLRTVAFLRELNLAASLTLHQSPCPQFGPVLDRKFLKLLLRWELLHNLGIHLPHRAVDPVPSHQCIEFRSGHIRFLLEHQLVIPKPRIGDLGFQHILLGHLAHRIFDSNRCDRLASQRDLFVVQTKLVIAAQELDRKPAGPYARISPFFASTSRARISASAAAIRYRSSRLLRAGNFWLNMNMCWD